MNGFFPKNRRLLMLTDFYIKHIHVTEKAWCYFSFLVSAFKCNFNDVAIPRLNNFEEWH